VAAPQGVKVRVLSWAPSILCRLENRRITAVFLHFCPYRVCDLDVSESYGPFAQQENVMDRWLRAAVSASLPAWLSLVAVASPATAQSTRIQIRGELVDTFCTVSEIMFASGTAHYQCAVWCAVGGVPVSVKAENGELYMILRIEEDDISAANPRLVRIQGHEVSADGELIRRDGVNYILVTTVADDKGVVKLTHEEHGIQPFGN
jgi:hypothetical protein